MILAASALVLSVLSLAVSAAVLVRVGRAQAEERAAVRRIREAWVLSPDPSDSPFIRGEKR